jgi:mannitol-1-phosphate/altronate dehydrogenase
MEEKNEEGVAEEGLKNDSQHKSLSDGIAAAMDAFRAANSVEKEAKKSPDKAEEDIKEAAEEERRALKHADTVVSETLKGES